MTTEADGRGRARRVIRFGPEEARVVQLVGRMPFVSSREVSEILGMGSYSRARVMMDNLSALGHVASLKTAGADGNSWEVKRFVLTARGIGRLADLEGISIPEAVRRFPVSLQWRRAILRRLGSVTTFYRLTALVAEAPLEGKPQGSRAWFSWRRTGWLDGTIMLGGGRRIRVRRFGSTLLRKATLHYLGSLVESWKKRGVECVLIIVPDHTELRLVERWLGRNAWFVQAYCVVERDLQAARQWSDLVVRRPMKERTVSCHIGIAFGKLEGRETTESASLDGVEPYRKPKLPGEGVLGRGAGDRELLSWIQLGTAHIRALRIVSDWPLGLRSHLVELGASSRALSFLHKTGLVHYAWEGRYARCVLSDAGGRYLAAMDRSSLGSWRERWLVSVVQGGDGYRVSGGDLPSRARLSADGGSIGTVKEQIRHQDQLLETCVMLGRGWRGGEVTEVVPSHRSERWAKIGKSMRAIKPDAIVTVRGVDERERSLSIEYEQRAQGPVAMDDKLQPYRNYYRHYHVYEESMSAVLKTLFVFPDTAHASRFGNHCMSSWTPGSWRWRQNVFVSSVPELREGFEGDAWLAVGGQNLGKRVSFEQIVAAN